MRDVEIVDRLNELEEEALDIDGEFPCLDADVWVEIVEESVEEPLTEQEKQEIHEKCERAWLRMYEIHSEEKRLLSEHFLLQGCYPDEREYFGRTQYTCTGWHKYGYFVKKTVDDDDAWSEFGKSEKKDIYFPFGDDEERARYEFHNGTVWRGAFTAVLFRSELYVWEGGKPVLLDTIEY